MRLAAIRHQLLVAMGLPACYSQPVAKQADPLPTPVVESPRPREPEPAPIQCGQDTVHETVCGLAASGNDCGDNATVLAGNIDYDWNNVVSVTEVDTHRADYLPDARETRAFRRRVYDDPKMCCYTRCAPLGVNVAPAVGVPQSSSLAHYTRCIPAPQAGTTLPAIENPACPQGITLDGKRMPYEPGNHPTLEHCCYGYIGIKRNPGGRPARVEGVPVFAALGGDPAWLAEIAIDVAGLPPELRARLAASWLAVARMEHASIAAFSSLSLRLLALGAPPELLTRTHAAALDEIRHARLTFALASAYAGQPLAPGALDDAARLATSLDLGALALETFIDGCIAETAGAVAAERAAERARDPIVAALLRELAADELRHAELAWAIVAWCVRRDPSILPTLRVAMQRESVLPAQANDPDLVAHGVLDETTRADVMRELVAPCLQALA